MYTRLSTGWLVEVFLFFSLSIVSNLLRFAIRNMALLAALVLTALCSVGALRRGIFDSKCSQCVEFCRNVSTFCSERAQVIALFFVFCGKNQ